MPELAEVEFYRKRWDLAARGGVVTGVHVHAGKKVFRASDARQVRSALIGASYVGSEARAKQMLFSFAQPTAARVWLGVHLGMSGELSVQPPTYQPSKHDHLVITIGGGRGRGQPAGGALVYTDPRMFGQILLHEGGEPPGWWMKIAPAILSRQFTVAAVGDFLRRRRRAPIKAVLLMQERFPGVGNWMADEILWRAAVHPARAAGSLSDTEIKTLWRECRTVCRQALAAIAGKGDALPADLNIAIPRTWLFKHRWRKGGKDPLTGTPLAHATIGGRTTCWSPAKQRLPQEGAKRAKKQV